MDTFICKEINYFKKRLKDLRKLDDNVNHTLNTTDTHSPSACAQLFSKLSEAHVERCQLIEGCVKYYEAEAKDLETRPLGPDEDEYERKLRYNTVRTKLRTIKNELTVEDIVLERTVHEFHQRCHALELPREYQKYLAQ